MQSFMAEAPPQHDCFLTFGMLRFCPHVNLQAPLQPTDDARHTSLQTVHWGSLDEPDSFSMWYTLFA